MYKTFSLLLAIVFLSGAFAHHPSFNEGRTSCRVFLSRLGHSGCPQGFHEDNMDMVCQEEACLYACCKEDVVSTSLRIYTEDNTFSCLQFTNTHKCPKGMEPIEAKEWEICSREVRIPLNMQNSHCAQSCCQISKNEFCQPAIKKVSYKVKTGDSLFSIAHEYSTAVRDIVNRGMKIKRHDSKKRGWMKWHPDMGIQPGDDLVFDSQTIGAGRNKNILFFDSDVLDLARTLWGEARGEREMGQIAVAWTIINRARAKFYPICVSDVVKQHKQYSCWNKSDNNYKSLVAFTKDSKELRPFMKIARGVLTFARDGVGVRQYRDPTKGSTHYFAYRMIQPPDWVKQRGIKYQITIGGHKFYKSRYADM